MKFTMKNGKNGIILLLDIQVKNSRNSLITLVYDSHRMLPKLPFLSVILNEKLNHWNTITDRPILFEAHTEVRNIISGICYGMHISQTVQQCQFLRTIAEKQTHKTMIFSYLTNIRSTQFSNRQQHYEVS